MKNTPHRKPLSPTAAIKAEIRTLNKATDKIVGDAAKEDRRMIADYTKKRAEINTALKQLDAQFNAATKRLNRTVDRELKNITSRRQKLEARLATI